MKRNFTLSLLAASLVIGACSTNKLAQNIEPNDDVYTSRAVAKEVEPPPARTATTTAPQQESYYDDDSYMQGYYDGSYTSRLNRFYRGSAWRSYYNSPFNNYNYYNGWNNPRISMYLGFGPSYYDPFFDYYGYNGSFFNNGFFYNPYFYGSAFGGYNSYNSYFPGYSYAGGFYSPGTMIPDNSRTRPNREAISRGSSIYGPSSSGGTPSAVRPARTGVTPSTGGTTDRISSQPAANSTTGRTPARPERTAEKAPAPAPSTSSSSQNRPERVSSPPSTPSYSPPASSPAPASSAPSSSGSSRPSRGGR